MNEIFMEIMNVTYSTSCFIYCDLCSSMRHLLHGVSDKYAVRFIPRENGLHYIHVRLSGNPIPGSPFPVMVGAQDAEPSQVRAYGEGLTHGRTSHICKFIVNTQNAGSGALAVTIDGPSKVKLNCVEVEEGYEFTYTPTAPGDYLITIKYAGQAHIPGSPFKARIEGR